MAVIKYGDLYLNPEHIETVQQVPSADFRWRVQLAFLAPPGRLPDREDYEDELLVTMLSGTKHTFPLAMRGELTDDWSHLTDE